MQGGVPAVCHSQWLGKPVPCHAAHDAWSVIARQAVTTASSGLAPVQGKPHEPDVLHVMVSIIPAGQGQHPLLIAGSPQERAHV
jgi:hypothetical protein